MRMSIHISNLESEDYMELFNTKINNLNEIPKDIYVNVLKI